MTGITPRTSLALNMRAVNLLVTLENAVTNLPVLPDASECDKIAVFSGSIPTGLAKEEAWEYLDLMPNRFLGFNRMAEGIFNELQGGARGLSVLVRYLKDFVGQYEIDGALLEGNVKVQGP